MCLSRTETKIYLKFNSVKSVFMLVCVRACMYAWHTLIHYVAENG